MAQIRLLDRALLEEFVATLDEHAPSVSRLPSPATMSGAQVRARLLEIGLTAPREAELWWSWRSPLPGESALVFPNLALMHLDAGLYIRDQRRQLAAEDLPAGEDLERYWATGWIAILDTGGMPDVAIDCAGPVDGPCPVFLQDPSMGPSS